MNRTSYFERQTTPGYELVFDKYVHENTQMYFDWSGRLRVVDQRKQLYRWQHPGGPYQAVSWQSISPQQLETGAVFEEFRYDALGRRVVARGRPASDCTTWCKAYYDTYVWSGDQLMHEVRREAPTTGSTTGGYYGSATYTYGSQLDVPVSMIRVGDGSTYTAGLHANRKGHIDLGTLVSGARVSATEYDWAGLGGPQYPRWISTYGYSDRFLHYWLGSLVSNKTDASGLVYMRNRYYDPVSGQFTQVDPIGMAGGLNLYGYADGDPINFSDPFGLCPQWLTGTPCSGGVDFGVGFVPGLSTGVDVATLFSGENPLTGESVGMGGRLIAFAGMATPASGGAIRGAGRIVGDVASGIANRIGRNSVSIRTSGGLKRVDLQGRAHGGVETPPVQEYRFHANPQMGQVNSSRLPVRPADWQDLREVERILRDRGQ